MKDSIKREQNNLDRPAGRENQWPLANEKRDIRMQHNFLELVKNRYSCRAYKPRGVEKEKLDYSLECVRLAPSAVNKQPWIFYIVSEEEDKAKLQQCYSRDWFKTAPMYVIASILHDEEWVRADGKHHGDIDIAIAVEHLCLAMAISMSP